MKKRGYTLLELIIVMAILVVLMPVAVRSSSVYKLIDNITVHSLKSDIANLISFAKHYSYNTGNTGRLEIDNIKGEISFVDTKNEYCAENRRPSSLFWGVSRWFSVFLKKEKSASTSKPRRLIGANSYSAKRPYLL